MAPAVLGQALKPNASSLVVYLVARRRKLAFSGGTIPMGHVPLKALGSCSKIVPHNNQPFSREGTERHGRDEDDEYDSEDEGQCGLFGGMLQHNKRGSGMENTGTGTLTGLMEKLGASMTLGDDSDSDDGSVAGPENEAQGPIRR